MESDVSVFIEERQVKKMITKMTYNQFIQFIEKLSGDGEKVFKSEEIVGLYYLIKDGEIIFLTKESGTFCIKLNSIMDLCKELKDIYDVWGDVKTEKCIIHNRRTEESEVDTE